MDHELMQALRDRYDVESWHSRRSTERHVFVWNANASLESAGLPGFARQRVIQVDLELPPPDAEVPPAALSRTAAEAAPARFLSASHTLWRSTSVAGAAVRVDLFECASLADAHDLVVWLLGEFESPYAERKTQPGDVAFGGRGDTLLLFARANLVYLCRNVSRVLTPVFALAAHLDEFITAWTREPLVDERLFDAHPAAAAAEAAGGDGADVELDDVSPERRAATGTRWFVADAGEVFVEGRRLIYRPPPSGPRRVAVYMRRA